MPDGVARSDAVMMSLPNTEASLRPPLIVVSPRKRAVEIKLAFAAIGGKQDDVPIKPIAHGVTRKTLVALVKENERARAKAKRAKAKARKAKATMAKVMEKDKARAREADLAHPAVEQRLEPARQQVDDRLQRTRKMCV